MNKVASTKEKREDKSRRRLMGTGIVRKEKSTSERKKKETPGKPAKYDGSQNKQTERGTPIKSVRRKAVTQQNLRVKKQGKEK